MRSALARSALLPLLLLWLPPPASLSTTEAYSSTSTTQQAGANIAQVTTTLPTGTTTAAPTTANTETKDQVTTTLPTEAQTPGAATTAKKETSESTGTQTATQVMATTQVTTTHITIQETITPSTGSQATHQSTSPQPTTVTPQPSYPTNIPNTTSFPSSTTIPSSTQQPSQDTVTSKLPSPEGSKGIPTASSSSGSMADRTFPFQETPTTPVIVSLSTPQGSQQTSSKTPAISGITASGPVATTPVISPGIQIKCQPPERLNQTMLILNVTETRLCLKSPPDDKLVTLLCRAAKSTFNPNQDQCHIQLVPGVQEIHEVAIKEITIRTNLPPNDIYKLLKDKWDEMKAVGVSNMQFGDQGPPEETEDRFSMPLIITIVCMASFLLLVAALYGCCHQRLSQRKDQQRLTEELQTVENGYHDNPTLEVMETSSDMQEKKVANLNGELGDSWIVPLDNLTKDDLDEEEDTHL